MEQLDIYQPEITVYFNEVLALKKVNFNHSMSLLLNQEQRRAIEQLADSQETTLGAAARFLIDLGISAAGLNLSA